MLIRETKRNNHDKQGCRQILNYYIENTDYEYQEYPIDKNWIEDLMKTSYFIIAEDGDEIVGWGLLRAHSISPVFKHTAEMAIYVHHEHLRNGIGKSLFDKLIEHARKNNIDNILVSISSTNDNSMAFFKKMGFVDCGRFRETWERNGKKFDEVWMQLQL